jgi:hypothetical protein
MPFALLAGRPSSKSELQPILSPIPVNWKDGITIFVAASSPPVELIPDP